MNKTPRKKARSNGKAKTGVDLAIAAAGTQAELARVMGVGRALIHHWKAMGVVPPGRVIEAEKKTGVPRHKLNPKIYPAP
jgi:DNA-binding transcriptional regulator YdaS (Cro superfamily)